MFPIDYKLSVKIIIWGIFFFTLLKRRNKVRIKTLKNRNFSFNFYATFLIIVIFIVNFFFDNKMVIPVKPGSLPYSVSML